MNSLYQILLSFWQKYRDLIIIGILVNIVAAIIKRYWIFAVIAVFGVLLLMAALPTQTAPLWQNLFP